jgi:SnoaL-like domain
MSKPLTGVVAEFVRAVNAFDTDAIMATFADDAVVNDVQREIAGVGPIRRWIEKEITGEHVTMAIREVVNHHGNPIVRALYDGDYDKTGLPKELILTNYFTVRDEKIVSLFIVFNKPSPFLCHDEAVCSG